jgi:prepilin-type N-terminal cleavage/methylation domain-containing protein
MQSKRGFTLVELLVVVGIIAVLVAILLPALNKARQAAKLVTCSSQLRQVVYAARMYANENRDQLPPWPMDNGSPWFTSYDSFGDTDYTVSNANAPGAQVAGLRARSSPYWINAASGPEVTNPTIGAGIGRLVLRKYLQGPFYKVGQCPAVYDGESYDDLKSYHFNAHVARRTAPDGATLMRQPWWKTMSKHGRVRPGMTGYDLSSGTRTANYSWGTRVWSLASDPMTMSTSLGTANPASFIHTSKGEYAVNLAQSDGSVVTARISKKITRVGSDWAQFTDLLGYIESAAAGRGAGSTWTASKYDVVPVDP